VPPHLLEEWLRVRGLPAGAVVLAEGGTPGRRPPLDWLPSRPVFDRCAALNANNTFGFEAIDWGRLAEAARITTVSRYMKQLMWPLGVDPLVVPNGLPREAFDTPDRAGCDELRRRFRDRTVVVKMARWDPDKRWLAAVEAVALMKQMGMRPLLVARGDRRPTERTSSPPCESAGSCRSCAWRNRARGLLEAVRDLMVPTS
jgi:glycosyltransferase involved in cell wall biosynthesis